MNEFLRDVQTVAINIMQIIMKLEANEQTYIKLEFMDVVPFLIALFSVE